MNRIFEELEAETARAGHDLSDWFRKSPLAHGYHDHQQQRPGGDTAMALTLTELTSALADLATQAQGLDSPTLDKYAALAGNPAADALLANAHVPADDLAPVVAMLNLIGSLVPQPEPAPADAEPQP